jgi:Spy/CpxP family protein refolding chaperone
MNIHRKLLLALLSLAIILPASFARPIPQAGPGGPNPALDQSARPDGPDDDGGRRGGGWRGGWDASRGGWGHGDNWGMHGRHNRDFMLARLVNSPEFRDKLGITADQAAKIRQQTTDFRKAEIRGRADLEVKRLELRDLLAADNPDRSAIDQKLQEISAARLTQEKSAIDYHLAMRSALTPEQRLKLDQMREEFRHRRLDGGRRGPDGQSFHRRGDSQGPPPPANPPASN